MYWAARSLCWLGLALSIAGGAQADARKPVRSADDLPHHTYALNTTAADVLTMPPQAFETLARPMLDEINTLLAADDITDQATLRTILSAKLAIQIADGTQDRAALATIQAIRSHQDKPEARLVSGLAPQAFLEARLASKAPPGVCPSDFQADYTRHLQVLPWALVGEGQKRMKGLAQLAKPSFLIAMVAQDVQPALDTSHALTSAEAWTLLAGRMNLDVIAPCQQQIIAALGAYVAQHDVAMPNIWTSRSLTLADSETLTPVAVAIWDSGVDPALFKGRLLLSAGGTPQAAPAFDISYYPTTGNLAPLTADQQAGYARAIADQDGISDLQNGIDSPMAASVRTKLAALSPAQAQQFFERSGAYEDYEHGTHVAGIAAAGNPAIRLASARVTWDEKPIPTPPTDALMQRMAASFTTDVAWFRAHHIRVVNMSWWDRPSNFEDNLQKNGIGKDADDRKRLARRYFTIERDALYAALKNAPDILFVTIAGNNNTDNAFEETIPSSFQLPNLLVVGAVDLAGNQTNFTSTGQNIAVYANGYQVASTVPGGATVRMSGTSMAAPAVVGLAAKLLAINPKLDPIQLIALIKRTASPGGTPGILCIDPEQAMSALQRDNARPK